MPLIRPTLPPPPRVSLSAWMTTVRHVLSRDLNPKEVGPLGMTIEDLHFYLYDEDGERN